MYRWRREGGVAGHRGLLRLFSFLHSPVFGMPGGFTKSYMPRSLEVLTVKYMVERRRVLLSSAIRKIEPQYEFIMSCPNGVEIVGTIIKWKVGLLVGLLTTILVPRNCMLYLTFATQFILIWTYLFFWKHRSWKILCVERVLYLRKVIQ